MTDNQAKQPSLLKSFVAGGVGGMSLVFVGHPFDTIKVKIQTMQVVPGQAPPYTGLIDCARKTVAEGGLRGLYRGMSAPLIGVTPMYALCFLGYGVGKKIFCDETTFRDVNAYNMLQIGLAGAFSAVFTTPILAPGERIKCLLQVRKGEFNGPNDVVKHLYKTGGIRSLNRGFMATFARDSLASLFYFGLYEKLKKMLTPEGATSPSILGTLTAGGCAGIGNWLAVLPLDTLKTRLQVAPDGHFKHGIRSVFVDLVKREGIMTLYRGFVPVMIRAFPANAACFGGYEAACWAFDYLGID